MPEKERAELTPQDMAALPCDTGNGEPYSPEEQKRFETGSKVHKVVTDEELNRTAVSGTSGDKSEGVVVGDECVHHGQTEMIDLSQFEKSETQTNGGPTVVHSKEELAAAVGVLPDAADLRPPPPPPPLLPEKHIDPLESIIATFSINPKLEEILKVMLERINDLETEKVADARFYKEIRESNQKIFDRIESWDSQENAPLFSSVVELIGRVETVENSMSAMNLSARDCQALRKRVEELENTAFGPQCGSCSSETQALRAQLKEINGRLTHLVTNVRSLMRFAGLTS